MSADADAYTAFGRACTGFYIFTDTFSYIFWVTAAFLWVIDTFICALGFLRAVAVYRSAGATSHHRGACRQEVA